MGRAAITAGNRGVELRAAVERLEQAWAACTPEQRAPFVGMLRELLDQEHSGRRVNLAGIVGKVYTRMHITPIVSGRQPVTTDEVVEAGNRPGRRVRIKYMGPLREFVELLNLHIDLLFYRVGRLPEPQQEEAAEAGCCAGPGLRAAPDLELLQRQLGERASGRARGTARRGWSSCTQRSPSWGRSFARGRGVGAARAKGMARLRRAVRAGNRGHLA